MSQGRDPLADQGRRTGEHELAARDAGIPTTPAADMLAGQLDVGAALPSAPSVDAAVSRSAYSYPRGAALQSHGFDRIVVVANAHFFEKTVEGAYQNTVGGLVSGVCPVLCGLPGSLAVSADVKGVLDDFGSWEERPFDAKGVAIGQDEYEAYYGRYSNGTLWPIFHSMPDRTILPDSETWSNYCRVNSKFAESVADSVGPKNLVWFHDYHLMLAPQMLREQRPEVSSAYFHHIPWPESEVLTSKMPQQQLQALMKGLLGADLIGFHTMGYVKRFLQTVTDVDIGAVVDYSRNTISFEGRTIAVCPFPISIDGEGIKNKADSIAVNIDAEAIRFKYDGMKLLFGVERLDYTKGIEERLLAIGNLLERRPDLIGRVKMVQYCCPSREGVEEYQRLRERVEAAARAVNARFGTSDWQPIDLQIQKLNHDQVIRFCRAADVVVVTPIVDGMNLVAKEARVAMRDRAVLVLGRGAGAAEGLPEATLVDGAKPKSIAQGLSDALNALEHRPEEVEEASRSMRQRILQYPVPLWGQDIVEFSRAATNYRHSTEPWPHGAGVLGREAESHISASARHAGAVDFEDGYSNPSELASNLCDADVVQWCIDFDGCVVPIVARPEFAQIDAPGLRNLQAIARDPQSRLAIVSGRSVDQLRDFMPQLEGMPVTFCGMHGGEIYDCKTSSWLKVLDPAYKTSVAVFKAALRSEATALGLFEKGIEFEDKGFSLAVHYRNAVKGIEIDLHRAMEKVLTQTGLGASFEIRQGKMVLELLPKECSKGNAVEYLYNGAMSEARGSVRLFVAGDDLTDESAFVRAKELSPDGAVTVRVGDLHSPTQADSRVAGPDDLHSILLSFTAYRMAN